MMAVGIFPSMFNFTQKPGGFPPPGSLRSQPESSDGDSGSLTIPAR